MAVTTLQLAELISLGMSVPTIVLALVVVYLWGPTAVRSLRAPVKTGQDWFIVGVALGFIGSALDNSYWTIPWTLTYLGHPESMDYVYHGVYFNIFFRQGLGMAAAFCHIKAARMSGVVNSWRLNILLASANFAGLAYSLVLLYAGTR